MTIADHQGDDIVAVLVSALNEAREQVSILQCRLGIVDSGFGTLSIIDSAIAFADALPSQQKAKHT